MFPAASPKRSTGIMGKTITISHTYNPFLHGALGALREPSRSPPGATPPHPPIPRQHRPDFFKKCPLLPSAEVHICYGLKTLNLTHLYPFLQRSPTGSPPGALRELRWRARGTCSSSSSSSPPPSSSLSSSSLSSSPWSSSSHHHHHHHHHIQFKIRVMSMSIALGKVEYWLSMRLWPEGRCQTGHIQWHHSSHIRTMSCKTFLALRCRGLLHQFSRCPDYMHHPLAKDCRNILSADFLE